MPSLLLEVENVEKKSVTILFCLFSFNGTTVHVMEMTTNHFCVKVGHMSLHYVHRVVTQTARVLTSGLFNDKSKGFYECCFVPSFHVWLHLKL